MCKNFQMCNSNDRIASSIAHEMKNDRNAIYDNYNNIVDLLVPEYGMWEELNLLKNLASLIKIFLFAGE